jgi:AraC-like DNA-binding protein
MSDPHKRLADVAFASGFDSISSFNRAFRQHAGMSPTQYRLSLRSSGNPPSSILHPPLSSSPKTAQRNPSNA